MPFDELDALIEKGPTTYVGRVLFDEVIVEKEEPCPNGH